MKINESLERVCQRGDRFDLFQSILRENQISHRVFEYGDTSIEARNIVISYCNETEFDTVFGAHFDRVKEVGGANDNAAGCLILIELALRLKREKYRGSLALVLLDNEEPCHRYKGDQCVAGSYLFSKRMVQPRFLLILDAIGFGDVLFFSEGGSPEMISIVRKVVPDLSGKRTPGSDDLIMRRNGIDSLLLSSVPCNELTSLRPATWSTFHTEEDVPDRVSSDTIMWVADHLKAMIPGGTMLPVEWMPSLGNPHDKCERN